MGVSGGKEKWTSQTAKEAAPARDADQGFLKCLTATADGRNARHADGGGQGDWEQGTGGPGGRLILQTNASREEASFLGAFRLAYSTYVKLFLFGGQAAWETGSESRTNAKPWIPSEGDELAS